MITTGCGCADGSSAGKKRVAGSAVIKVKVKFALEQALKTSRDSIGTALLFL